MTPAIAHAILAISDSLIASIIIKATAVLSLALLAARLALRSRASIRHAILAAAFGVLFALPIAAIVTPPIHMAVPMAERPYTVALAAPHAPYETSLPLQPTKAPPETAGALTLSLSGVAFAAWGVGAAIFLAPIVIGLCQVRFLRRSSLPWSSGDSLAALLAKQAGLRRPIEVLLHESVAGPMTCGILRPAILFPAAAENWNRADLHRAIAHELEHVRRADWLSHCLARIVCGAYWFLPLVWIAWRRLALEAERSCDDAVLSRSSEPAAYAEQLVALARQLSTARKSPLLAMASRSDLGRRVAAVLDPHQHRGRIPAFAVALAATVTLLLVLTISPLKLVAAAQSGVQTNNASLPSFEVASVKPHQPRTRENIQFLPGGRFSSAGVPLQVVIAVAYDLPFQGPELSGGPDWIRSGDDAYDIEAKAEDGAVKGLSAKEADQKMRLMLQTLLADRFKLVVQREMKEQPVYILTVAKNGPKLEKSKFDQQACTDPIIVCGSGGVGQGRGIHLQATTVADMVFQVNSYTDRPLLDQTGLTGLYDIDTTGWTPMRGGPRPSNPQPGLSGEAEALADPNRPTLSMIFDELGLKMQPSQAMVESFTIEHVERPTSN